MRACIVLAGGAGRRMGGIDKAALRLGDATLLDGVLAAAQPLCSSLVVVGPWRATAITDAVFTIEEQPGGGPVPAVVAGLHETAGAEVILVLAVDLPFLSTRGLRKLLRALHSNDAGAAAAADHHGHPNPLLAAFRADALHDAAAPLGAGAGTAASRLLPADTVTVELDRLETFNVNTPADLAAAVSARGAPVGHRFSKRQSGLSSR